MQLRLQRHFVGRYLVLDTLWDEAFTRGLKDRHHWVSRYLLRCMWMGGAGPSPSLHYRITWVGSLSFEMER